MNTRTYNATNEPVKKDFLGIPVRGVTRSDFVEWVIAQARGESPKTAYAINAHSVNLAFKNADYWEALQNADMVYCDGISVYWGSKILRKPIPEKLTTTDCIGPIAEVAAAHNLTMSIVGNRPGVTSLAADKLREQHPGLQIVSTYSGYFDKSQEQELIENIRRDKPQILWVGMGNPIQELWVEKHKNDLQVPVVLTCGGMMEIVAGVLKRPPLWITDNGMEWAYRLVNQPRRTWKRYLVGNVVFVARLASHACRRI